MFKIALVATSMVLAVTASDADADIDKTRTFRYKVMNKDLVNEIKQKQHDWEAFDPEENPLKDLSDAELQGLIGTIVEEPAFEKYGIDPSGSDLPEPSGAVPTSFDART